MEREDHARGPGQSLGGRLEEAQGEGGQGPHPALIHVQGKTHTDIAYE